MEAEKIYIKSLPEFYKNLNNIKKGCSHLDLNGFINYKQHLMYMFKSGHCLTYCLGYLFWNKTYEIYK